MSKKKSLSVRKRSILIHTELGKTSVTVTTIQKRYKLIIEDLFGHNVNINNLSSEEQIHVDEAVRTEAVILDRKHKRQMKKMIEDLEASLPTNFSITDGGIRTAVSRKLANIKKKWMELTDKEQDDLIAQVREDTIKNQSNSKHVRATYYLDGKFVGSLSHLFDQLQSWDQSFGQIVTFKKTLKKHFPPNELSIVHLTTDSVLAHLTIESKKEKRANQTDPTSLKATLERLCDEIKVEGVSVSHGSLENRYRELFNAKKGNKGWRSLSAESKNDRIEQLKKDYGNKPPKPLSMKSWQVHIDGEIVVLNSREVHSIVKKENKSDCISYQPFCKMMNTIKELDDNSIISKNIIIDIDKLKKAAFEKQKTLPGNVYKLTMIGGQYDGYIYIGFTQSMLTERLKWHKIDAVRIKNLSSTRKIHVAIHSAILAAIDSSVTDITEIDSKVISKLSPTEIAKIELLECNIEINDFKKTETKYIKKFYGDTSLNSTNEGLSHGGRGSTRTVTYNNVEYGFSEAIRVVAKENKILDDDYENFAGRLRRFFYQHKDFTRAANEALQGENGRKSRNDQLLYCVDDNMMTINDIVLSEDFPNLTNEDQIKSCLRRHGRLGKYAGNVNVAPILKGEVKPNSQVPDMDAFLKCLTKEQETSLSINKVEIASWSQLAKAIRFSKSSVNEKAKRFASSPTNFWAAIMNQYQRNK
ncbi:hypothetical protein EDB74_10475 [Vibrio crassostreae]|uniref:hypothetical protein n=1 Tax=Vibrio crassostreae TaxID=246167 RepID=UPI0010463723|nr:hypothetical protein [Vibrio crassostreae]TCV62421.1 hypothetical protein EDB74_10475 [Vibrio crassostreae]CAK2914565.1 hypothetical protein VCRA2113O23_30219 [Vibrio crassostreae]